MVDDGTSRYEELSTIHDPPDLHFIVKSKKSYAMRRLLLLLLLLFLASAAHGQRALTLQQSIDLAQTSSPAAEIARLTFDQSLWGFRSFRAQYRPSLSVVGSLPGLRRSIEELDQDDGTVRYVERNLTSGQARLTISQPIPMTGGQVTLSSGLSRRHNQFGDTEFTQWQSTPLVIGLTQPLFQFNEMKWTRRTEPMRYELARRSYIDDIENIAIDITNRFFAVYMAQMDFDIATFNAAINDTIFTLSQGRFEIGKIAENDLLQSELALLNAQSAQSSAEIAHQEALQDLKLALDLPYDAEVTIVPPTTVPLLVIDPDEAVAKARRSRPAFLDLEIQSVEAERDWVRAKRTSGFSASLNASYGLNQSAGEFDGAYRDPLSQQQFSINFLVPIFRWGQGKADIEAAVAQQQQVERNTDFRRKELDQEVYFEVLKAQQLQQQVGIAAKADTVAARRFEVAKNRYLIGKIDITELFNAQREKDAARQAYIRTMQQFWQSYFNLRRLTLYDFIRQEPLRSPQ